MHDAETGAKFPRYGNRLLYILKKRTLFVLSNKSAFPDELRMHGGLWKNIAKRSQNLIANMRKIYPNVDISIYRSAQNISLNCALVGNTAISNIVFLNTMMKIYIPTNKILKNKNADYGQSLICIFF